MAILLIYELVGSKNQKRDVEGILDAKGYKWSGKFEDTHVELPNNSVFHTSRTPSEAIQELTSICASFRVLYRSAFATEIVVCDFAPNNHVLEAQQSEG